MKPILLLSLILFSASSPAANHYIRSAATGPGDGTDWTDSKAWTNLPATFVRGDTYFVGAGTNYTLSATTAAIGTTLITVKKPTVADHGTATGWSDTYATATAYFIPRTINYGIMIAASYFVLDGATGGGPTSLTNGHGFKFTSTLTNSTQIMVMLSDKYGAPQDRVNVTNVTVAHLEIEGTNYVVGTNAFGANNAVDTSTFQANFHDLTFSNLYIHDVGGLSFNFQNATNVTVDGCWSGRNCTAPTAHGTLFRMDWARDVTIRNSWFEDAVGTGFIGAFEGMGDGVRHLQQHHLLLRCRSSRAWAGDVTYGTGAIYGVDSATQTEVRNWRIYNNTFFHLPNPNAVNFYHASTNNNVWNNLFWDLATGSWNFLGVNIDYAAFGSPTTTTGGTMGAHNITLNSSPFLNAPVLNQNTPAIGSAANLNAYFTTDFIGTLRGSSWDIGAYEYPNPISSINLTIIGPARFSGDVQVR